MDAFESLEIGHVRRAVDQVPFRGELTHLLAAQVVLEKGDFAALEIALGLDSGEVDGLRLFFSLLGFFSLFRLVLCNCKDMIPVFTDSLH